MSSARIRKGDYSEADVLATYMKYREAEIGPFIREVGDFIAHPKRDRGSTLTVTMGMVSQIAFFATYNGKGKRPLCHDGPCEWWLKTFFVMHVQRASETELLLRCGLRKKEAEDAVASWFEGKTIYPTRISVTKQFEKFERLARYFSGRIFGLNVFETASVRAEVAEMLRRENLPAEELDNFLVATGILLSGRTLEPVPGFKVTLRMEVGDPGDNTPRYTLEEPDGELTIMAGTIDNTGGNLVKVGLLFANLGVNTKSFFARRLVFPGDYGFPRLHLGLPMSFESSRDPKVDLA